MPFVADASVTLPWCLKDEETAWTIDLLRRLGAGERIFVPAHWPNEVSNGLLMASRRGRVSFDSVKLFWDQLDELSIIVDSPLTHPRQNTS